MLLNYWWKKICNCDWNSTQDCKTKFLSSVKKTKFLKIRFSVLSNVYFKELNLNQFWLFWTTLLWKMFLRMSSIPSCYTSSRIQDYNSRTELKKFYHSNSTYHDATSTSTLLIAASHVGLQRRLMLLSEIKGI